MIPQRTATSGLARRSVEGSASRNAFQVGIIGCGPRGLYCLQSLADRLQQVNVSTTVSVTILEPCEFPGAGNVYDPRQPKYLKMNFAAKHIDAWPRDQDNDRQRFNLVDWLSRNLDVGSDDFVPRAAVGNYLHDCFVEVCSQLKSIADLSVVQARVDGLRKSNARWHLKADQRDLEFDHVVLTVGHEGWRASELPPDANSPDFQPAFPVHKHLGKEQITPGSRVAIRGFGLTWIDAALAMTEGRGGEFRRRGLKWSYVRSGREPKQLIPFSRTGRPMLAKPDESLFPQPYDLEEVWSQGRAAIDAVLRPVTPTRLRDIVWQSIIDAASSAVNHFLNGPVVPPAGVEGWFRNWCCLSMKANASRALMQQSYAVATGQAAPDVAWALGAAWRNLYPAIARCVSHGGLSPEAWPQFRKIAVEMERIAFGPPAENLGRMLALIDAGIVDLRFVTGSLDVQCFDRRENNILSNGSEIVEIDHFVNAVLPSPLDLSPSGPLQSLLSEGFVERLHDDGGIHIDCCGRPIVAGTPTRGLTVLGRATEGCVLGNDSLSRTLHDHPRHWAEALVEKIRELEMTSEHR